MDSSSSRTVFEVTNKEKIVKDLEKETQKPDFWRDKEKAAKKSQELVSLKEEIGEWQKLEKELIELRAWNRISEDEDFQKEIEEKIEKFKEKLEKEEIKVFLSGKYDKNNAILQIFSGAGGIDAQDWATMLLRMYERYCARKGFQTKVLHQSFGEGGGPEGRIGTKSATLEIKGPYAYGFLKKETGVHRLVRISPFSAQKLRHTSFVLVEILPEIGKAEKHNIEIKPDELKIETFRASGPGGQYVNRRETAVRITHLPTKITVSSQSERLQGQNKEKTMEILYSKLYQLKEAEHQKKLKEIKGGIISASWGNQIRSYILHPYKLVKDLRTNIEKSNVEEVLDGNLDEFIEAEIKTINI
ncbi:MAG: peptide chain release factor 2 [Candidatus Magasanikbacteria bacterium]|nr:peptide chain release factor 2 [Candidatus Magasanikbacteria bacterium]